MKSIFTSLVLAATALSLTACTDSQISFGAGVIVGAIISDGGHHHHHRPNPPRYRPGRRRYHSEINLSQLSPTERVAVKYNLTSSQAQLLTSELVKVQKGDLTGLTNLGFETRDLLLISKGQNPSASTLNQIGLYLGLEIHQAHELIQNIKADVVAAQSTMM
jgi:hypothetical protein